LCVAVSHLTVAFRAYIVISFVVSLGFFLFNPVLPDFSDIYADAKKNKIIIATRDKGMSHGHIMFHVTYD
jgi:hypothetical protein